MSQCSVQYVNIPASIADPDGSKTFGRIRIRSGTEINVSDPDFNRNPKLDPKKICKKKPYFQAVLASFILFTYFTFTSSCTQCCGSVTFWYGSRSADPCLSRNWGKTVFLCLKMKLGKNVSKKNMFWPVSDLDPNPGFGSRFESGIRIRIRN